VSGPRRLFVLGGSSGIGLAVARVAVDDPELEVHVTASSTDSAARADATLQGMATVHVVDLRTIADDALRGLTVGTDVLVLCAAVEYVGPAALEPPGALQEMLAVNVRGPAVAIAGCVPTMVQRGEGLIVGLGSIVSRDPRPFLAGYSASKAAFETYLHSLQGEVASLGVDVQVVVLGPVETDLGSKGPKNWDPAPASPYSAGFALARNSAIEERALLVRTPADAAEEVLRLVWRARDKRSQS